MDVINKVSDRVLRMLSDAYWTLKLIEDEQLNETVKADLRGIRAYAKAIIDLVNEILSKSDEEADSD